MTISTGTRLGPYEVIAPIGAGGMGEVYKANDTRLDRTVAIKVLPEHLAESPERKARFEREAKAISQLNHPHICTLYDVGEQDGIDFIVMEYIEGETLAERLKKGALPLDKALEYGIQIADGLDTAHRAGIVHRDLKPANAMLTKSGIKLLDFGLARLVEEDLGPETSDAPTRQKALTNEESIIGTLQYMAPEQLERKSADARTDIFAFGAVLYEMVTGNKAFEGTSQASLVAAIMSSEPLPLTEHQALSPPLLDHIISKCLTKDRDARWQSALDLRSELRWIVDAGLKPKPGAVVSAPKGRGRVWGIAGLAIGAVVVALALGSPTETVPPEATRFVLDIPSDHELVIRTRPEGSPASKPVALSPDGRTLVYAASAAGGPSRLFLREFGRIGVTPIPGTEGGRDPIFSPDGEWIGFRTEEALKKVSLAEGDAVKIVDAPPQGGVGSWGADDTIVYETGGSVLMRVRATGGDAEPVTTHAGTPHWGPQIVPNGQVMFTSGGSTSEGLTLVSMETGEVQNLEGLGRVQWGRYLPTGHLLFRAQDALMAVPFDLERREVEGAPVSVLGGVSTFLAFSQTGTLAAYVSQDNPQSTLVWIDREGRATSLEAGHFAYHSPRLSPDGRRVSFDATDDGHMWVYDTTRGARMRLTVDGAISNSVWTPDGERLAFVGPTFNIYTIPADGSGDAQLFLERENRQWPMSFSPDGRFLAITETHPDTGRDIWVLPVEGEPIPLLVTPFNEGAAKFSPDGRLIAYVSDESGRYEIYVRPFPGPVGKSLVSLDGGTEPEWSQDGTELFYRQGNAMMVVATSLEPSFSADKPKKLFVGEFRADPTGHPLYDVAPDGQRFLMVRESQGEARAQIHVVLNWFEELERLVPTDRR